MSKSRMLGAGLASSTVYNSNVNLVQFGDKLQGLAPTATQFFIPSGRGGGRYYRSRTYAPRRNFVFGGNRLGGVGAGKSQFKIRGLNRPDGARRHPPYAFRRRKKS